MTEPANKDERTVQAHAGSPSMGSANVRGQSIDEHDSGDRLPIGMRLAEFEIIGYVGDGGFSIVYLAWDHSLERQVALKEYMPSSLASRSGGTHVFPRSERHRDTFYVGLKSFINEGKLLAQFDHPSLVKVYRFWESHGTAYMVMPYYEGITLKDAVRAMPQPPDEAWLRSLLDPLMAALSVIHQAQCFHRDIAPDNVMLLAGSGKPLLLDFGAARRVISDKTQALTVILKPGYAPIEQYAEDDTMRQGAWTDVYALAAVIYWAVTGKTPPAAVGRVLNDAYVPLAKSAAGRYSLRFLGAVDRALVLLPEQRTPSVEQFREDLGLDSLSPVQQAVSSRLDDTEATVIRPARTPIPGPEQIPTSNDTDSPGLLEGRASTSSPLAQQSPTASDTSSRNTPFWLRLIGIASLVLGFGAAGLWWMSKPGAPQVDATVIAATPSSAASPAPSAPPPEPTTPPAQPPTPLTAQAVLDQVKAASDQNVQLKASLVNDRNGATHLAYEASERGYAYVLGFRANASELTLLYPPSNNQREKNAKSGKLVFALPTDADGQRFQLLWARERRDLAEARWIARDAGWVRSLDVGSASAAAAALWGAPVCAPNVQVCDPAFGMTEVIDMTNVTPPPAASSPVPSTTPKPPPVIAEKPTIDRSRKAAPTEEKSGSRATAASLAKCQELFSRASLGDTSPALIEQMKSLRCGN